MQAKPELVVALDVSSAAEAQRIVTLIGDSVSIFKVGKQLFTAEGPGIVRDLIAGGRRVFLDLKFHDIPHTVAEAVRAAAAMNVHMLTVHASGGRRMLEAATEVVRDKAQRPLILAVTVITSFTDEDLAEIAVPATVTEQVKHLAALAKRCACDGAVSSPREAANVRRIFGPQVPVVTPGIRPEGSSTDDQARIATPAAAIRAGASHLVVGRPITASADPFAAARSIIREMEEVEVPAVR